MNMMHYNVAVALLVIAVSNDIVSSCPSNCYCTAYGYQDSVDCSYRGLTVVPRNYPNHSYSIIMNYNPISTIEEGSFQNMALLYRVDLDSNKITTIQQGAFTDLPRLQLISLKENNLTFVKNDTFEHNNNLQELNLDLVCDCNVPFWSWLKSQSIYYDYVTCLDRDNVQLSSLQNSDFDNCTYVSCYPEYCSNGGSCSQNSYGDLVCSCVGGWIGTTCTVQK
ncbi:SLIT2 [Mytilus edulis]|uniref:SLIT2 n=1 Tax=Mytilus edulis TaxID=6550 RepID=A0A8S3RWA4_MYTED|nr:SLIT2 [Mytilus edulis]